MADTVLLAVKLLFVTGFLLDTGGARVVFSDGRTGLLAASHKEFRYFSDLLGDAFESKEPVGVAMNAAGAIEEVVRADVGTAVYIAEGEKDCVVVRFQERDGTFALKKDHPQFRRILDLLNQSRAAKARVWTAVRGPRLVIDDAVPFKQ